MATPVPLPTVLVLEQSESKVFAKVISLTWSPENCTAKSTLCVQPKVAVYKSVHELAEHAPPGRLMTFAKTFDSDCSNTSTVGNGTGVANAAYPNATQATGTVTLNTTSPIGPGGGTGDWSARLVQ